MSHARLRRLAALGLPVLASLSLASALNEWVQRNPARIDFTSDQVYSIGPETRRVIARLERPVEMVFFHDLRSRAMQDARYLLEQYAAATPLITLTTHDPTLEPAAAARHAVRFAGTTVLTSGGRRVQVNEASETAFTNGLIRVTSDALGRVCFSDGHTESNPFSLQTHDHFERGGAAHGHDHASGGRPLTVHERHGMGMARNALETLGYVVEQRRLFAGPDALAGCTVLVVASPQVPFAAVEVEELRAFMLRGGAVLLLLEPAADSGLDPLLAEYGVAVGRKPVEDPGRHYWTERATPAVSDYGRHKLTRNLALSFFPGAVELAPTAGTRPRDVLIVPLVETSASSVLAGEDDATRRRRTLMLEATRPAQGSETAAVRLIVAGDGDFATNSFFGALGNGQLFLNAVSYLSEHERLIDIAPREYRVAELRLSNAELRATFLATTVAGPVLLACVGGWTWARRR